MSTTSDDVLQALRVKYPISEYAFLPQVRSSVGFAGDRTADVVVVSLWPSRGLEITGIEIKVSRGDWRKELKKPAKAEAIAENCDRWLVAAPPGVVKIEEVPAGWGWLELVGAKFVTKKDAPKLEPKPLALPFVAALLRQASKGMNAYGDEREHVGWVKGLDAGKAQATAPDVPAAIRLIETENASLRASIAGFEAQSGIKITHYNGGQIGAAVRLVYQNEWIFRRLPADVFESAAVEMEQHAAEIRQRAGELKKILNAKDGA